jgi:hypothetical protein
MNFIKRILNFPRDVFLLMYGGENKDELDLLSFLIMVTFGIVIFFLFAKTIQMFPPVLSEIFMYLLAAKFGQVLNNTFRKTGGLTINRSYYNPDKTVTTHQTNSIPTKERPAETVKTEVGGKSRHVEGNPEEEI